ncbi:bifunctional DNA-binding transcriptional regulator/O6-methylguanine-DNA methyltransferase Ada [Sphingomonas nostoxanthinifaciens]|uniref:bifunctional DNA-binding transcriptional regulator/O6-methylguanine-DNA methyltransferase Ada n=1 Tax=Sphingomonas nostoxanthinifaciens TaxID=2872652 RepID=UPI001CC1EFE1|nr:bifunctional DNA-binding transcriptional regulator/O6-methylguanine-DNA methyltransferase Ada [Sphingomonas nostoxanthinifaciens]UAK23408.1 bifunctional DNA-binding transcriptional regulator/O6-methylguanine-DNA methyltransferase Ada [Sphingomonas nostoxanthinifaciens]
MANVDAPDSEAAWAAVLARDRTQDGRFVTGVLSTGIYCRPSCAARHPRRENVRFFADGMAARMAGLRPCLRCRPDEVARDEAAVARAIALIEAEEAAPDLGALAAAAGYSPHHFHRLFKRATGVTPAAYVRARRAGRLRHHLKEAPNVTDALYEAGYAAPSRFYADAPDRLGMTPSVWRDGGRGATIRWTVAPTDLGALLVAATERGICRVAFEEDDAVLRRHFPRATIVPADDALDALVAEAVAIVAEPGRPMTLPLDVQGTAFQEAVWRELARIPPGATLSYAALAARAGNANAVRAVGSACGANPVALLIPCHRAKRSDGTLGGYAYGLPIKRELLDREAAQAKGETGA